MISEKTCNRPSVGSADLSPGARQPLLAGLFAVLCGMTPVFGQEIAQTEQDDSFSTANPTGLTAGSSGIKVAYGHTEDGAYANGDIDFSGDFDFFMLSANAGQVISVDLKNAGITDDFDSFVGVYGPGEVNTVVAFNDDIGNGNRSSKLSYTAATSGTYYVVVSNWINVPDQPGGNLPGDPSTPGSGQGLPGGTGGPYEVVIGLDANAPIVGFDTLASVSGNPVPLPRFVPVVGFAGFVQTAPFRITNTGNADLTITAAGFTGTDAAKFAVEGLTLPVTISPNASETFTLRFNGDGLKASYNATLDLTSNDPVDAKLPILVNGSSVDGKGSFTVRQVYAASGTVENFDTADALLAGTNAGISATQLSPLINYSGGDPAGSFGSDRRFPATTGNGEQFAAQATGPIFIREAGSYSFRGRADDGERLVIDGQEVFRGTNVNLPAFGAIELTAGIHNLEYTMYENAGGDNMELSISQKPGDYFANEETTWQLVEAYSPDTDSDTLPDQYETNNGLDPGSALTPNGAGDDFDSDGLSNLGEYVLGTKANDPDTDDDLLSDLVETDTGVWVSATNTGSDPLVKDTDGDGFLDNVENLDLPTTGPGQPGTDPNKADTDEDGFSDPREVGVGTDPKLASSFPPATFPALLTDNFDGVALNSTYAFTTSGGGFTPLVTASGVPANLQAIEITSATNSNNNSVAWNKVASAPIVALRLNFDFRISSPLPESATADGIGIGLFRTATYGETGANNPAATGPKNWEDPSGAGGIPDALAFGFAHFNSAVRMIGPAAPTAPLVALVPPFALNSNQFHRATVTMYTNVFGGTYVSLQMTEDVNGAATVHQIFTDVLVPGFDLPNESFRLIAGGLYGRIQRPAGHR
ncbi:PA14 domain-containing protein [Luteolibacter sp. Populi]|uniref:PA14 domain-containing protein n=1 Tax=Luteolibacter sp. Populi TaxID=3230487 RepID=UPI00346549E8